jgi:hypothetical protein
MHERVRSSASRTTHAAESETIGHRRFNQALVVAVVGAHAQVSIQDRNMVASGSIVIDFDGQFLIAQAIDAPATSRDPACRW